MKWRVHYLGRTRGTEGANTERRAIVDGSTRAEALANFWTLARSPEFDEVFAVDPLPENIDPDSPHSWQQIAATW